MKKYFILFILTFCTMICCGSSDDGDSQKTTPPTPKPITKYYINPVIKQSIPDPSVIRDPETRNYYLYGTEDTRNIPIYMSEDLVNWGLVGTVFTENTRPNGNIWAPEICRIKNKYVLFYSLWNGNVWDSFIGYAISDSPRGPFVNMGPIIQSRDIDVEQSIDQFYYEENGKFYMFWGSFRNLYVVELDITANLAITAKKETKKQIAGNAFEGTNIYKHNGYYYLFASIGNFEDDTYRTVVGRSENILGPYVDKQGKLMLNNGYEILLGNSNQFYGLGHNAGLIEDDDNQTWILYHGYEAQTKKGRYVFLDKVQWDNQDWPYIQGGVPSMGAEAPIIN